MLKPYVIACLTICALGNCGKIGKRALTENNPQIVIMINKDGDVEDADHDVVVEQGANFSLSCIIVHAQVSEAGNLTWSKILRDSPVEHLAKQSSESFDPLVLNFTSVPFSYSGNYKCEDFKNNLKKSVQVHVVSKDSGAPVKQKKNFSSFSKKGSVSVVISQKLEDGTEVEVGDTVSVSEGGGLRLICKVKNNLPDGDKDVTFVRLDLIISPKSGESLYKQTWLNSNELDFNPSELKDAGRYVCLQKNTNLSKPVLVKVFTDTKDTAILKKIESNSDFTQWITVNTFLTVAMLIILMGVATRIWYLTECKISYSLYDKLNEEDD